MVGRVGLEPTTTRFLVRGCLAFHITVIEDIIMSDKDFFGCFFSCASDSDLRHS